MRCLVTGGSGRLGTEIKKYVEDSKSFAFPSHEEFDICDADCVKLLYNYDLIIHCAGYTDVAKAEIEKDKCYQVNVTGTVNLLKSGLPFVFISSEYAYKPVNYYSVTKALAEREVALTSDKYLIIRTLFKSRPYPYDRAFTDQWTQGDYVDVIAPLIMNNIINWYDNRMYKKLTYVGTGRKTIYDLAKRTKPDVKPCSVKEVTAVKLPEDYT